MHARGYMSQATGKLLEENNFCLYRKVSLGKSNILNFAIIFNIQVNTSTLTGIVRAVMLHIYNINGGVLTEGLTVTLLRSFDFFIR